MWTLHSPFYTVFNNLCCIELGCCPFPLTSWTIQDSYQKFLSQAHQVNLIFILFNHFQLELTLHFSIFYYYQYRSFPNKFHIVWNIWCSSCYYLVLLTFWWTLLVWHILMYYYLLWLCTCRWWTECILKFKLLLCYQIWGQLCLIFSIYYHLDGLFEYFSC